MSILFPKKCVSCGSYLEPRKKEPESFGLFCVSNDEKDAICDSCKPQISVNLPPHCPCCGVGVHDCICRQIPRAYDGVIAPFYYEGAIKNAIQRMKFKKQEGICRYLAFCLRCELCARCFGMHFDILTCVPATGSSIAERGFNQSRVIAESLKLPKHMFPELIPDYGLLIKHSGGKTQHKLGAAGRKHNTEKAFSVSKNRNISGKTILLVDDILTTGSTAEACAKVLKLKGAKAVYVATPAITRIPPTN